jgi:hypothetical protein
MLAVSFPEVLIKAPCWTCNIHLLSCVHLKHALWTHVLLWLQLLNVTAAQHVRGANVVRYKSFIIHHTVMCYSTKLWRIFSDVRTKFYRELFRKMKWGTDRQTFICRDSTMISKAWFSLFSAQSTVLAVCTTCYSIQRLYISFSDTINLCHIVKQIYTCPCPRHVKI